MGGRLAVLGAKGADHADGGYGLECGSPAVVIGTPPCFWMLSWAVLGLVFRAIKFCMCGYLWMG